MKYSFEYQDNETAKKINKWEIKIQKYSLMVSDEILIPGDRYLAKRNGPFRLLSCEKTVWTKEFEEQYKDIPGAEFNEKYGNWVQAKERAYNYDFYECHKIVGGDTNKLDEIWLLLEEMYENWRA